MPIIFEDCLIIGKLSNFSDDMVKELKSLIEEINKKERNFKIARAIGTTISVLGEGTIVVGFCLIPASIGTATIVMVVGSLAKVLGGTIVFGTEYLKDKSFKHITKTLMNLAKRREEIIKDCIEKIGLCEKKDFIALDKWDQSYDWIKRANRVFTLGQIGYGAYDSINLALAASSAINEVNPSNGGANLSLKSGLALAGLVFGIIDIYSLIKDWNKKHPSLQQITEMVIALENDIELFRLLFNIKNTPELSQQHFTEYFTKISRGNIVNFNDEGFVENDVRKMIKN